MTTQIEGHEDHHVIELFPGPGEVERFACLDCHVELVKLKAPLEYIRFDVELNES